MNLTVHIDTDNDAFQPDPGPELARIVNQISGALVEGGSFLRSVAKLGGDCVDINGNRVGSWEATN